METADAQVIVLAAIVAIVALVIVVKFWKPLLKSAVIVAALVGVGWLVNQLINGGSGSSGYPGPDPYQQSSPQAPAAPNSLPDFAIINARPIMSSPNGPVEFSLSVVNRGNGPHYGILVVQGPGNVQASLHGLEVGETKALNISLVASASAPAAQLNNIYFVVDPDNVIREWDENNNGIGPLSAPLR